MLGLNYMAWIGIVSWIGVPLLAFFASRLLWLRSQSDLFRLLALVVGVVILFTPALISNGVKAYYDQQVRELCAKDGGVKVYETVRLPESEFKRWRNSVGLTDNNPMESYLPEFETQYIREGNPKLLRYQYRVVRRSDGKVLGESIRYVRSGGDLPGPWERGTSFSCPSLLDSIDKLQYSIFQKGTEK